MARGQFLLWRDRQGEEWGTPKTSECLRGDRSLPRGGLRLRTGSSGQRGHASCPAAPSSTMVAASSPRTHMGYPPHYLAASNPHKEDLFHAKPGRQRGRQKAALPGQRLCPFSTRSTSPQSQTRLGGAVRDVHRRAGYGSPPGPKNCPGHTSRPSTWFPGSCH